MFLEGDKEHNSVHWRIENSEKSHIVENVEAHRLDGGEREIGK